MGLISCLLGGNSDKVAEEEDEEYDVCDKHGHDLRDYEYSGLESVLNHGIIYGIVTGAVPGKLVGIQYLNQKKTAVCRDCDHEETKKEEVERRIVFSKDGELKTISFAHYESLVEEYEAEQE